MSLQGLSAGQLLGYSTTHRSIQQWKVDLCNQHAAFISKQLQRANEVSLSFVKQHVLSTSLKVTTILYIFNGICPRRKGLGKISSKAKV